MRTPNTISEAIENSSNPPAMRNAGNVIDIVRSSQSPASALPARIAAAIRQARNATERRALSGRPVVMAMKVGTRPTGSTTTSSVTKAEMKNSSGMPHHAAATAAAKEESSDDRVTAVEDGLGLVQPVPPVCHVHRRAGRIRISHIDGARHRQQIVAVGEGVAFRVGPFPQHWGQRVLARRQEFRVTMEIDADLEAEPLMGV